MHEKIVNFRKRFGDNWLTVFPDGIEIPWRQLSLQEFLDLDNLYRSGRYTPIEVEDEIFSKAVLAPVFVENIDQLPSGVVSVVAAQVMQASGPTSEAQINEDLNFARFKVQDFISSVIPFICSVFPAYKPEDLLSMKYSTFMERLASAETRLLALRIITEPFTALGSEEAKPQQVERPSERKRRELLEQQKKKIESKLADLNSTPTSMPEGVITAEKMSNASFTFVPDLSNDPGDRLINQKKINEAKQEALSGLEAIYPEYFKAMKEGKKLTPEFIQSSKGKSKQEVIKKHEEYSEKLKSGEIKLAVPSPGKLEGPPKPGKVKVKRPTRR